MTTQEIPRPEWNNFFDSFSRQHEGWLTSLTVKQGEEQKTELRDCRLEGVSADHLTARDETLFYSTAVMAGTSRIRLGTISFPRRQLSPAFAFELPHALKPLMVC